MGGALLQRGMSPFFLRTNLNIGFQQQKGGLYVPLVTPFTATAQGAVVATYSSAVFLDCC